MPTKKKFSFNWGNVMDKIRDQENSNKNSYKDERIYYPEFTDKGTAQAIIRFLPSPDTDVPFVNVYSHSFKDVGGWYINTCPTTLKNDCPVCKSNVVLWEAGDEVTARKRKRKLSYYSNILVVSDPIHPENEGKVFLFKYGIKIYEKIMKKIDPGEGSIDKPIMIFDYYDGADFKLIIAKKKVGNIEMPNYDDAKFVDSPSSIGSDTEIEKIHNQLYSLKEFVSNTNFKSYTDLETKLYHVIGQSSQSGQQKDQSHRPAASTTPAETETENTNVFDGDDDEFFNTLQSESE